MQTKAKQTRVIPMSPRLKALLLAMRQREKGAKIAGIARRTNRVFLFRGKSIDRFDRAFNTACGKAGVKGLDSRHQGDVCHEKNRRGF
jgi:integrase